MSAVEVVIRRVQPGDVAGIARLCGQLGYPSTESEVARRVDGLASSELDTVVVALLGHRLIGWMHLHLTRALESEPWVEVWGLVVDEAYRRQGAGRTLLRDAERWAAERGCSRVRLRSNVVRFGAHAFYQREGFHITKTQYAFEKHVRGRAGDVGR